MMEAGQVEAERRALQRDAVRCPETQEEETESMAQASPAVQTRGYLGGQQDKTGA